LSLNAALIAFTGRTVHTTNALGIAASAASKRLIDVGGRCPMRRTIKRLRQTKRRHG
jgi:hypothetical protein